MTTYATEKKPITDDERIQLGGELAAVDQKLADVKGEKSAVAKVYGGRIRELEQAVLSLSRQLADGVIEHKFEIEELPDDSRQVIAIMRKDTGELFNSRPMNEAEKEASRKRKQPELSFEADENGAGVVARVTSMRPKARGKKAPAVVPAKKNGKRA